VTGPDQIQEILDTMAMFGVYFVNTKGKTKEEFWDQLQNVLDEEVNDLPPNNDMCEFIDLMGQEGNNEFFNVPVKELS
jgi:predicted house-cleaning noncanonical NTP pyrophosphatase (MazG superfamily)